MHKYVFFFYDLMALGDKNIVSVFSFFIYFRINKKRKNVFFIQISILFNEILNISNF